MIKRDRYLNKLIRKKENGMVKVITGIRRCGKSYLLFEIYHRYLNSIGVPDDHIIELALDDDLHIQYRNPLELGRHIRSLIADTGRMYYVFLDEIQKVASIPNPYLPGSGETVGFVDVVLGLMKIKNVDLYVTGSNSKMLSSDVLTEFRGRGDEIRVQPLSYSEFYAACGEDKRRAWRDYFTYGGMPLVLSQRTHEDKTAYLRGLFDKIYLDDIMYRHRISYDKSVLDDILDIVSSSVGSLTNPGKIAKTFASVKGTAIGDETIAKYLDYLIDAFLLDKAQRYDVKGRKYIGSPLKYYYADVGLRNARLNFFWGQPLRHGGWYPDYGLHLLPKIGFYVTGRVHQKFHHPYGEKTFPESLHLIHYPYRNWEHYFGKFNRYTELAALKYLEEGKKAKFSDILFHPMAAFFKMYVLKAGWRDGKIGFVLAAFHYFYTMAKYVKLYYLVHGKRE